tara:strand:+ start:4708 stop:5226 length:519 start_codon:yes stop_codon:yes gene_type:complete
MKKVFIVFLIHFFQFNFVTADTTIAYLDMNKIISSSKSGLSINSQLKDISSKNTKVFKEDARILKEQEIKLISQKNILSESDFQLKIKELKLAINKYNKNRDKVNNDYNKLRVDSTNKLLKLINPILVSYSNDNNISLILKKRDIVIGQTDLDITSEITQIINKEIKQFKIQ